MKKDKVEKAAEKAPQKPVGMIGLRTATGYITEEFLQNLQWPQAGKIYQEMSSNDAVIGGCLYLIETAARKAHWHVEPATQDSGDVEAAEFLESCMFDMQDQTWDDFICDVLSMVSYGFSFHEITYKIRRGPMEKKAWLKSNFTDGKIGWQELAIRSQATMSQWTYDEATARITEFVQDPSLAGVNGTVTNIPIEGNLLFKTKASRGNPEGWSMLRRAYRSWYFKRYIEELEGIGIERNLAGIPVLQPPPGYSLFNPEDDEAVRMLAWAEKLVNSLRQDKQHGVVLPAEWELKLMSTEGSGKVAGETDTIIRRHETRMAMSMLSDLVLMGTDRTGSFALAETKQGLFTSSIQALLNGVCATLNNKAVPKLFAVNNWTLEKLPKIVADGLSEPTIKEIALILRSVNVNFAKNEKLFNFILKLVNAPKMTAEEYAEFAASLESEENKGDPDDPDLQDGATNDFKQADESYTGTGDA